MRVFDYCKSKPSISETLQLFKPIIEVFENHDFNIQIERYDQIKIIGRKLSYFISMIPYEGTVYGAIYRSFHIYSKEIISVQLGIFPNDSDACADTDIFIKTTLAYLQGDGRWIVLQDLNKLRNEYRLQLIKDEIYTKGFTKKGT